MSVIAETFARNQNTIPFPATEKNTTPLRHIAAILDGNRRWALQNGLPVLEGYRRGGAKVHEFLDWCNGAGIPLVTLWPLSIDNLHREHQELCGLLSVITDTLDKLAASGKWRLHLVGDLSALPSHIAESMLAAGERTRSVNGMAVNIAIAYGGRDEIVHAVRALLAEHAAAGTLDQLAKTLRGEDIAGKLYTAGQPDPDLVIRSSGEQRLSGFMPWQSAYSEYYFSPVCWPEFDRDDFEGALRAYAGRNRSLGR